ncbi:MAG: energy transducer TonB [Candidatus Eisenbacteria sp.]|nr:energy transducer TonB [Candidatus Eisenbacteria bacterium]
MLFKSSRHEFSQGKMYGIAGAATFLIHIIAFGLWPEYVPGVYKLEEVPIPIIYDLPQVEIPPAPPEIPEPEIPDGSLWEDSLDDEIPFPETTVDPYSAPSRPAQGPEQILGFFPVFDQKPIPIHMESPRYPDLALKAQIEGSVHVLVTIDERGRVVHAEVASSTTDLLDRAAIDAAYKWRFEPARQADRPVRSRVAIPFRFSLRG